MYAVHSDKHAPMYTHIKKLKVIFINWYENDIQLNEI